MKPAAAPSADRERLLKSATYASTATALVLVLLKASAWLLSGSVSILAGFTDSLTDLLASVLNLFAVRLALRPADEKHTFGHGKAEGLSALAQAAFIGGSAVFLLLNALNRLMNPEPLQHTAWGIAVMVVSLVLTSALVLFQRYVLRRQASQAIAADRLHYVTDLLSNAVVLAGLVLAAYGWYAADGWPALLLSLWILKSAFDIGREAVNTLMDHSLSAQEVQAVRSAVLSVPEIQGVHDLKTRRSGGMVFVQLHIDLDAHMTLSASHDIAKAAAAKVKALFAEADVLVHTDPV
ncbi:cation diffusion facilitator family transporter [Neisseria dumasiana]|uniref:Uncharacterized protein n=1 Tax=Neisseria dumasiana TaxID=1931275 RepID=A0A1X3DKY4_9NEIS|nr:cation diffusion facilitator family transporter [Neisseria dumasiana]OSI24675.1 hypothetical protein BV912_02150 [Neisseria dumasiana]OSI37096.1 hypothetical protein BV913_00225 [Neisseria dumasiana]UOO83639.1 cation diffusion facilitator family transporter [Neisseria dumasiana]